MSSELMLRRLRRKGTLVTKSTIDLDPRRAREKLERYQLVDPHRYTRQFVQAAVLLGATYVDIRVDADEFEMTFDGEALTAEELDGLFLHAFSRREGPKERAAQRIAMGIIAAGALQPARIVVETESRAERVRLDVVGEDETLDVTDRKAVDPEPRHRIYVKEKFRFGHLSEFFTLFGGTYAEELALEGVIHSAATVRVNGVDFARKIRVPEDARASAEIDTPHARGIVWVGWSSPAGVLRVVQHGVEIEAVELDVGELDVSGVVEAKELATNLTQSAFVRNEAYRRLLDEIVMPSICRAYQTFFAGVLAARNAHVVAELVNAILRARLRVLRANRPVPEVFDRTIMTLGAVPIWQTMDAVVPDLSTADLFARIGEGELHCSRQRYRGVRLTDEEGEPIEPILRIDDTRSRPLADVSALAEATGRDLVDVTDRLQEAHREKLLNKQTVESGAEYRDLEGVWPHSLDSTIYHSTGNASRGGVRVTAGLSDVSVVPVTRVIMMRQRGSIERFELKSRWTRHLALLVTGADSRKPVSRDELLVEAAPLVAEALADLVVGSARWAPRHIGVVLRLISGIVRGSLVSGVLSDFGAADAVDDTLRAGVWRSLELAADREVPMSRRKRALGEASFVPIFETVDGARLTLDDLDEAPVHYAPETERHRALQIAHAWRDVGEPRRVVWLDQMRRDLLVAWLGEDALVDCTDDVLAASERMRRARSGIEEEPELLGSYVSKRSLAGDALDGEIGMLRDWAATPSLIEVVILHRGRRTAHRELRCPFGRFRAIIESERLTPSADLSDIVEDASYRALTERLVSVAGEMFEQWCGDALRAEKTLTPGEEVCVWRAVADAVSGATHPHRLRWPIFRLRNGDIVSHTELVDRVEDGLSVVTETQKEDAADVRGPVLSLPPLGDRIPLLKRLFPDIELRVPDTRSIEDIVTDSMTPVSQESDEVQEEATVNEDSEFAALLRLLSDVGLTAESVELTDDGRGPSVVAGVVRIGRRHPLGGLLETTGASAVHHAVAIVLCAGERRRLTKLAQLLCR